MALYRILSRCAYIEAGRVTVHSQAGVVVEISDDVAVQLSGHIEPVAVRPEGFDPAEWDAHHTHPGHSATPEGTTSQPVGAPLVTPSQVVVEVPESEPEQPPVDAEAPETAPEPEAEPAAEEAPQRRRRGGGEDGNSKNKS